MTRGTGMASRMAGATLALVLALALPGIAQKGGFHGTPQQHASAPHSAPVQHPAQAPRTANQQPAGHAGDWLRRYKDLSPAEQERALQNDPAFKHLPAAQQQVLRDRLQHFSNLPPQQQLQMLNRMDTWEHLTSAQKSQARQIFNQMRQLPPDRQRMVTTAVRDLRAMPADQRERIINSDRFKSMFSDQERQMMLGATRLPLAPAEGGEQ